MTNAENEESLAVLNGIYGTTNFYTFFNDARTLVQNYLLGGSTISLSTLDLVMGYTDDRIQYLYNTTDFFGGKEVLLEGNISPIF